MKVTKPLIILGVFVSFAIQVSTTPLHIGAFNLQIFGQAKFSDSDAVSTISRVSDCTAQIRCTVSEA